MDDVETSGNIEQVADVQTMEMGEDVWDNQEDNQEDNTSPQPETQETQKPQSPEENTRFAQNRRMEEIQSLQAKLQEAKDTQKEYHKLTGVFEALGYNGSPQDMLDEIEATRSGADIDEVREKREQREEEQSQKVKVLQERNYYKDQFINLHMDRDVEKISQKYPYIEVKEDLPEDYFKIMSMMTGGDPVKVYEMLLPQKETPPSTGSVKSTQTIEKEFYTEGEVDKLSSKELDNPKILAKVMKSMTKWK